MNKAEFLNVIKPLNEGENFQFKYKGLVYEFRCWKYENGEYSYSVRRPFDSMNVKQITENNIHLFSFDMMNTQTDYNMSLEEIIL